MGRKKLQETKNTILTLRITESQHLELKKMAIKHGVNVSKYLGDVIAREISLDLD